MTMLPSMYGSVSRFVPFCPAACVQQSSSTAHTHLVRESYASSGIPASTLKSLAPCGAKLLLLDLAEILALLFDLLFGILSVGGRCCAEALLGDSVRLDQCDRA